MEGEKETPRATNVYVLTKQLLPFYFGGVENTKKTLLTANRVCCVAIDDGMRRKKGKVFFSIHILPVNCS